MNKVEAKHIFSSILKLLKNKDPSNFERDYSVDLMSHINSKSIDFQNLRLVMAGFVEEFDITCINIKDFVFENNKAGLRFYVKLKHKQDGQEIDDHLFYIYHFKNNQVIESWVYTKIPVEKLSYKS